MKKIISLLLLVSSMAFSQTGITPLNVWQWGGNTIGATGYTAASIGTKNNKPVFNIVNNIERAKWDTATRNAIRFNGRVSQIGLGNSTYFGYQAGIADDAAASYSSVAFGDGALKSTTAAYVNVAIGNNAMANNLTGGSNTGVGYSALRFNTTGGNQCAYGDASLYNNTTGSENTAYGKATITGNVVGVGNTAMGFRAMQLSNAVATAGAFVTGKIYIIQSAGTTNFTLIGAANNNVGTQFTATGPGSGTGTAAPLSNYNTALGYQSMYLQNNGNFNTGAGYQSLYSNSNGVNNTGYGASSLLFVTTGTANIGLGFSAGRYATTQTNRLFINSIDRTNIDGDSTSSIIYGYQNSTAASQKLDFNAKVNILSTATFSAGAVHLSTVSIVNSNTLTGGNSGTIAVLSDVLFPVYVNATSSSPADAANYYIGNTGFPYNVNAPSGRVTLQSNCTLVGWNINNSVNGVVGTNETATFYIRKNNTTDTQLSAAITYSDASGFQEFSATGLSTDFSSGDVINIKVTTPTWATNPTQVYTGVTLWFKRRL